MSTIFTGVLIIACTAAVFMFFIFINQKNAKQRNKELAAVLNGAAAAQGLALSSQEIFKNKILGLDGLHKKLLVLNIQDTSDITCINLADIKSCKVKKEYEHVDFGSGKKADIELELRSIDIKFTFKSKPETFSLSFYDSKINSVYEMAELEIKARDWEILLSKMAWEDVATQVLRRSSQTSYSK